MLTLTKSIKSGVILSSISVPDKEKPHPIPWYTRTPIVTQRKQLWASPLPSGPHTTQRECPPAPTGQARVTALLRTLPCHPGALGIEPQLFYVNIYLHTLGSATWPASPLSILPSPLRRKRPQFAPAELPASPSPARVFLTLLILHT